MSMITQFGTPPEADAARPAMNRLEFFDGPLELSWQHCSSTAEFLADFFAEQARKAHLDANEARHNISYLTNELLENVIKFRTLGKVTLESSLNDGQFELTLSNFVVEKTSGLFQDVLEALLARDPGELLIERIEANAADPSSGGSGLGLLTLMNDYGVRLGWTFSQAAPGEPVELQTFACLPLS